MIRKSIGTLAALSPAPALAAGPDAALAADTVWIVTAAALVFLMQAGFALLEGGMSRSKNAVNVVMKNYLDVCVGSLVFWLLGYGLMFGANPTGWIGQDHFALTDGEPMDYTGLLFQTMFAATAATIASGAMAERTRFAAYLIGTMGITAVIYPVFGSWAWGSAYAGSGWLAELGFVDFAGSTVVHSVGGWVALAGVAVLGPRLGRYDERGAARALPGHNLNMVALGGFILWVGWFGFNGGSTLGADVSIGLVNLNTHLAAAAGGVGAWIAMLSRRRPVLMTSAINGGLGGLVAITAGCATMTPPSAVLTGLAAGFVVVYGQWLLERMRVDDVVGAVPVHGFAGVWGTLAAGLFYAGDMLDPERILVQLLGIGAAAAWVLPTALAMYWLIDRTLGLRVDSVAEQRGLDFAEHFEVGYPEFQSVQLHRGKA